MRRRRIVAGDQACRNLQRRDTPVTDDTTILPFHPPGTIIDPLTEIARGGARRMLIAALKSTALSPGFPRTCSQMAASALFGMVPDQSGLSRPGSGRSRSGGRRCEIGRRTFQPGRRSALHPISCRNGRADQKVSMPCLRCFTRAASLPATFRRRCRRSPNLSPGVMARRTAGWQQDHDRWQDRDFSARRHVCIWADGGFLQVWIESGAGCILVSIGATPEGRTSLRGFQVGIRESAQSWRECPGLPSI